MFGMLPVLHDNQTIYSWCGLTHALNGGTCARETSTILFGAPYAALSHDFPSRLVALERSTGYALGRSRDIALRNTLLGYYLSIVRQAQAERILRLLRMGTIPHLKMLLGITASRVGGHHPLKGCERCFADDEASRGWAYWHVEHQLPSTLVCTKHHCPLYIAWDPVTPVHRRHWLLPRLNKLYAWTEIHVPSNAAMDCLLRLATDSERLMGLLPATLDPERLAKGYQRILRESGLATAHGNLRTVRLVSLIKSRYRGLEDLPGLAPLRAIGDQWPGLAASLSRRTPRSGHPLKHLLLIGAISDSLDQFIEACASLPLSGRTDTPSLAEEVTTFNYLERFKELVAVHGKSLAAASHALGVSRTTGVQWAKRLKITYTSRGRPVPTKTVTKIRRLLMKGNSISSIAAASGVSMTTVYRIVGTHPEVSEKRRSDAFSRHRAAARRNFSATCSAMSDKGLKAIRSRPGNSYMWLYRNDHQWLQDRLSQQGRVSGRSR
jgi:transposase